MGLTVVNTPFSQSDKDYIYNSMYSLTSQLISKYKGTKKIFILQNHEGDWHTTYNLGARKDNAPTSIALQNYKDYFNLRQKAVNDARKVHMANDVYV
jgi:hypothetical protein